LSSSYTVDVLFPVYGKKYEKQQHFSLRNNFVFFYIPALKRVSNVIEGKQG
jgi:hypothetical protein